MLAVYSPTTMAPRRGGMLLLAALSLVGVVARVAVLLAEGQLRGFLTYGYWPPPLSYTNPFTRSMPYLAGMWACIVIDRRKQEERLVGAICQEGASPATAIATAPASCAAADGDSKGGTEVASTMPATSSMRRRTSTAGHTLADQSPISRRSSLRRQVSSKDVLMANTQQNGGMNNEQDFSTVDASHAMRTGSTRLSINKSLSRGFSVRDTRLVFLQEGGDTSTLPMGWLASLQQRLCSLAAHRWSVRAVDLVCLAVAVGLTFIGTGDNGAPQPHPTSFALAAPIWAAMLQLCTQCILCIR